jgi:uncharacterized protein YecE (DUF72 family)
VKRNAAHFAVAEAVRKLPAASKPLLSDYPKREKQEQKFPRKLQRKEPGVLRRREEEQWLAAPGERQRNGVVGRVARSTNIHIGTSGWSYNDWKGIFYPVDLKSPDWLDFYSQTFSSTEINRSFYRLPTRETVEAWTNTVPDDFTFCPKMTRFLTHIKRLKDPEEPIQRFFSVFGPMKKKMGPVLFQLPSNLKFDYERTEHLYKELKKQKGYSFAMEGRHETWLSEESLDLMTKYDIAFVISQSGVGFPYGEHVTSKNIYIRFHGPGKLYASLYDDQVIREFAEKINKWKRQGHIIWVYFNNDYFGYGIENGKALKEMVAG